MSTEEIYNETEESPQNNPGKRKNDDPSDSPRKKLDAQPEENKSPSPSPEQEQSADGKIEETEDKCSNLSPVETKLAISPKTSDVVLEESSNELMSKQSSPEEDIFAGDIPITNTQLSRIENQFVIPQPLIAPNMQWARSLNEQKLTLRQIIREVESLNEVVLKCISELWPQGNRNASSSSGLNLSKRNKF